METEWNDDASIHRNNSVVQTTTLGTRCKTRTGVTDDYLDVFSVALELSSRILALGLVGISLSTSIEKNEFVASLIQQLKVPVAIAYSILVAINFLTLIQTEYEQSKLALQIRGISGSGVYLKALSTMMIRLMRQSEYTAMAMELRGFSPDRVQKIQLEISILDLIYSSLMSSFIVIVIWLQQ